MTRKYKLIVLLLLCWAYPVYAFDVAYQYDDLNRLKVVNYGNGQQTITYAYDAAGNILSKDIAVSEQSLPNLTISSPANGAVVFANTITISGTATDAGQGDNGIASVTVNGVLTVGGSAIGAEVANWSNTQPLFPGSNLLSIVATDASPFANTTTQTLTVIYLPQIIDTDSDGLPNIWEVANNLNTGLNDASVDSDLDGFTNAEEYAAGTDPQLASSKPEGVNGINYVLFRDHFDDDQYEDRWFMGAVDPGTTQTLLESESTLQGTVQLPASACTGILLESFATIDAINTVLHAQLRLDGEGITSLGLIQDQDLNNSIEIRFNNKAAPVLTLHSWEAGIETIEPAIQPVNYAGQDIELRLLKLDTDYHLIVNGTIQASVTNAALGDISLRPYISEESCTVDANQVDSRFDLIEILLDRDADGRADLLEDKNVNGIVDTSESDPLVPDADNDTVLDGLDNCMFKFNDPQRDTDNDGYGNVCDADFNNNGIVDPLDFSLLKSVLGSPFAPDQDLNGNGIVDPLDFSVLKSKLGQPPGPSGLVP